MTEMLRCFILCLVACASHCLAGKLLPSYFPKCYLNDPKLNECLLKATDTMKPNVLKGIEEIKLPSFEPLITEFGMSQETSVINYTAYWTNFTLSELQSYNFTEIQYSPDNLTLKGRIGFKAVPFTSILKAKGSYRDVLQIDGNGIMYGVFGPSNLTFEINGEMKKRQTEDYYNPTGVNVSLEIEYFDVHPEGLIPDNPILANETSKIIREHSKGIIDTIAPAFSKVIEEMWMRFLKSLTRKISYNELFPISSTDGNVL